MNNEDLLNDLIENVKNVIQNQEAIHTDIFDMITDMRNHVHDNNACIVANDIFYPEVKIGFICSKTYKQWFIDPQDMKKSIDTKLAANTDDKLAKLLLMCFRNQSYKQALIEVINQEALDK